jgi:hypothetical protein
MSFLKLHKKAIIMTLCIVLFLLLPVQRSYAQEILVTLFGAVYDTEKNSLPGASITVRNLKTGYEYSVISQDDGLYRIAQIQPGLYEMNVELQGFVTGKKQNLTLNIGAKFKIDFGLPLEKIEEEIVVTAETPLIEISKSEVSSVITREEIESLPLKGRDYMGLAGIQPGVQSEESGYAYQVTANGQPWAGEEVLVDGVSNTQNFEKGRPRSNIPADAIQEFRALTNQFAAEYGNASGLMTTSITRSGGNEFKGRVSNFWRSDAFDAKNYFARDIDKTELDDWYYGGFFGGPIKKDKTHFFFAYEGRYLKTYKLVTSPLVPQESVPYKITNNQFLLKINHNFSGKNFLTFRFTYDEPLEINRNVGGIRTKEQGFDRGESSYDFQGNWTLVPSDNTLNELRLLYGKFTIEHREQNEETYWIQRPSGYLGGSYRAPFMYSEERFQIVDNFSLFLKNHTIKIGFDISFIKTYSPSSKYYYPGLYRFATDEPFDPLNPATYPFVFFGAQNEFTAEILPGNYGFFIQDSWHIHRNITLNIGLRYNYYTNEYLDIDNSTWKSFNPRFGFSWDVIGDSKTVIRGGIGTFSNSIMGYAAFRPMLTSIANFRTILFPGYPDPDLPNPFLPTMVLPSVEYIAQEGQIPPYMMQVTLGAERQLFKDIVMSADFIWSRGYHLLRDNNLNPGIPGSNGLLRPDMTKGDVFVYEDSGKSDYKALQIGLRKRYSRG